MSRGKKHKSARYIKRRKQEKTNHRARLLAESAPVVDESAAESPADRAFRLLRDEK